MRHRRATFMILLLAFLLPSCVHAAPEVSSQSQSAIVKAVRSVGPAVVNIDTTYRPQRSNLSELFRNFFGEDSFGSPQAEQAQGSGFVLDGKNGYVVTNEHVIHNAEAISITLPNKKTFSGKLIGSDRLSDIAVVKVDAHDLPSARLSSDKPVIGQWAIAIGNPFGFQNSVTVGVISATERKLKAPDGREMENLLQTDASINPGNSGGPLCDINGDVVGMNTAIIPYGQGLGFAISADTIQRVVSDLIHNGRVIRPWVGFAYITLTPQMAERFGLEYHEGALIQTYKGYSADRAGLHTGDIIVEAAKKPVKNTEDLDSVIKELKVDDRLQLAVLRDGRKLRIVLTVGEMPEQAR